MEKKIIAKTASVGGDPIKVTFNSVLNSDQYERMTQGELALFIQDDVSARMQKHYGEEWVGTADVESNYTVIDTFYNRHDEVHARMRYIQKGKESEMHNIKIY